MMSPNDESVLSAYIDGELDPLDRRAVESSLASNPRLAEEVRRLSAVRDLVSELSRPVGPDVSGEVLRRVCVRLGRRRPWIMSPRALPWAACALAVSALIGLLVVLPALRRHPAARNDVEEKVAVRPAPTPPREPARVGEAHVASSRQPAAVGTGAPVEHPAIEPRTGDASLKIALRGAESGEPLDHRRLRSLIDDPRLHRVFFVTDQIGESVENQVASFVERTSQRNFLKITVSEGIIIDPLHPGKATVFAVVLDETQLDPFRKGLMEEFKDRVQDQEVDPAVAMQLADIGQVVSLPAHPIADVTIPDSTRLAFRTEVPTVEQENSSPAAEVIRTGKKESEFAGTTPYSGHRSEPSAHAGQSPPEVSSTHTLASPGPHPADDHHRVVLVWVSAPSSG
jgi:anti-sigma factor RsiW